MRVHDLTPLGLSDEMLAAWRNAGVDELTDIQERCLTDKGLLAGENALIIAPTSAGKTFVGEVLAVRAAHELKRVLYVVPFKALAEEKFRYFRELYGPMGISVAVSSGDRDEFDDDIKRGRYLITIAVNEKLGQLLIQTPGIISDCGLVVIDEVQLIRDIARGPQLEMLLTRLLLADERPQLVALSATVGALNRFDAWLGCRVIRSTDRPVPLLEHALTADGRILRFDPKTRRLHQLSNGPALASGGSLEELTVHLVKANYQVLVFRTRVEDTQDTAEAIATALPKIRVSADLMASVGQLEDSEARAFLERHLAHGVAYHNAGLSFEERILVEQAFRSGHLKVVVSTTTLAMGVNLPADAVVVADCRRWDPRLRGNRLIDVAEYKNCAGRAGRLGQSTKGEAFLVVGPSDFEEGVVQRFLAGTPEAIESAIPRSRLIEHVLSAVVSGLADSTEAIRRIFGASFAAATFYREQGMDELERGIQDSLVTLSDLVLINVQPSGQVRSTALGEAVARLGVSIGSAARMISFLQACGEGFADADAVFEICGCEEVLHSPPFLRPAERFNPAFWRQEMSAMVQEATAGTSLTSVLSSSVLPSQEDNAALKRSCLALRWRAGHGTGELTAQFRIGLGFVRGLGENLSWLLETMAQLAAAMSLPNTTSRLSCMAQEMHHGVPLEAVPFARLRVRGLHRDHVIRLVRNETGRVFSSFDEVLDAGPAEFVGIISPALVMPLQEAILRSGREGLQRQKAGLLVRARRLSVSEALIDDLFESQGRDFEVAVESLLNAHPLTLGAARVRRQPAGQMDIHVPAPDGGSVVISATSSEDNAKPISWQKAREVLGAVGAQPPVRNFVVVGKPDFHQLARENADTIAKEPGRMILLIPAAVLGELYMRIVEGKANRDLLMSVLVGGRGYLTQAALDRPES